MIALAGLLAAEGRGDMMDDEQSLTLFIVVTVVVALLAITVLPLVLRRISLRKTLPAIALIGPALAVLGSFIGSGAMTLSGHDVKYVLTIATISGVASILVGLRLARPLACDLEIVGETVTDIARGDRSARTGIDRGDEIGALAAAVDELGRSLARAEAERSAADEERQAVVSALSHDLRTPLASLLASVDALEDGAGDGPGHVRAMRSNILALERLVEDMFLLARADSGQLGLQVERLDLAELVDEALEAIGPTAAEQGVRLRASLTSAVPVRGDDTALGRVLRNLLDNAVRHAADHHPEGGGIVDVAVDVQGDRATAAPDELSALVEVSDNGPGFDADFAPRAFDRFTQADSARSRHGGAGLGLAIAQTLVTAHGGTVTLGDGPGGVVRVRVPLDDSTTPVRA